MHTVKSQFLLNDFFNLRNVIDFKKDTLGTSLRWATSNPGKAKIRMGHSWVWLLNNPADVEYVLKTNAKNFDKNTHGYKQLRNYLGDGLLSHPGGESWLQHRRLMQPLFHKNYIDTLIAVFYRRTLNFIESIVNDGEWHDLRDITSSITLGILGEAIFSQELEGSSRELNHQLNVIFDHTKNRFYNPLAVPLWIGTPANRDFHRAKSKLHHIIAKIIQDHRDPEQRRDLLSLLIAARDADTNETMNDQQIADEVITMLQAGHETTANSLNWILTQLHLHPQYSDFIREDLGKIHPSSTWNELENLSHLQMVIHESLRLDPPAWAFDRRTITDDVISETRILADEYIFICPYTTHRHPNFWEKPNSFYPEHFSESQVKNRHKWAYIPFGGGPRVCIGNHFSMLEMKVILSAILTNCQLEFHPDNQYIRGASVTLRPASPIHVKLRRKTRSPDLSERK